MERIPLSEILRWMEEEDNRDHRITIKCPGCKSEYYINLAGSIEDLYLWVQRHTGCRKEKTNGIND